MLEEPLRTQVRVAFASSMQTLWLVMIGIAGAGFLSVFFMKEVAMGSKQDAVYGINEGRNVRSDAVELEERADKPEPIRWQSENV